MPSLKVSVPHQHDRSLAAEKVKEFSHVIKQKYGDHVSELEETWEGETLVFRFSVKGFRINGRVDVDDRQVNIDSQLPFAAMIIRGRIEKEIRDAMTTALA